MAEAWDEMRALADWRVAQGHWRARRAAQARHWFEQEVRDALLSRLKAHAAAQALMAELGDAVAEGRLPPTAAAEAVLATLDAPLVAKA